jgi:glutathione peroxidase-family protein
MKMLCIALMLGFLSLQNHVIAEAKMSKFYDFSAKDIDGNSVSLSEYKDKVILVVNTASKCGFTPQYEGLQNIYTNIQKKALLFWDFLQMTSFGKNLEIIRKSKSFAARNSM